MGIKIEIMATLTKGVKNHKKRKTADFFLKEKKFLRMRKPNSIKTKKETRPYSILLVKLTLPKENFIGTRRISVRPIPPIILPQLVS